MSLAKLSKEIELKIPAHQLELVKFNGIGMSFGGIPLKTAGTSLYAVLKTWSDVINAIRNGLNLSEVAADLAAEPECIDKDCTMMLIQSKGK